MEWKEPGKVGFEPKTHLGIWVGKTEKTAEHIILTPEGVVKARTIFRRLEGDRWDGDLLQSVRGKPWNPSGVSTVKPTGSQLGPGVATRAAYVTKEMLKAHGPTPECARCAGKAGLHTHKCKERFAEILRHDSASQINKPNNSGAAPRAWEPKLTHVLDLGSGPSEL